MHLSFQMNMNAGALSFGKKQAVLSTIVIASTILWTYFFSLTGITVNDLFTFKFDIVLAKMLTIEFAAALATMPLPIATITAFARRTYKENLMVVATASTAIAATIAMAAFPVLQGFWMPAIAYLISIPLLVETAYMKYSEAKTWVTTRTMLATMSKTITLLSIGLALLSITTILPQQEQYIDKFEGFIMDFTQSMTTGNTQQTISTEAADMLVETQIATVNTIVGNQAYKKLEEKTDPDVMAFVALADASVTYIKSDAYKQEILEKLKDASSTVVRKIDIMDLIKQQFPMFGTIEQFLWLFQTLTIVGIFSLAASIICKPMAVIYGATMEEAAELLEKDPREEWQEKKSETPPT